MEYSRQRQSGSVVVYVIVSIVLVAAVVGAIIVAQNRANQQTVTRPSEPVGQESDRQAPAEESQETDKSAEERQKEADKEAEEQAAREKAQEEARKLAEERAAAEREAAAQQEQAEMRVNHDGPMARTGGSQAGELPTTGPVEDLLGMATGLLAIVGAGYLYYHFGQRKS